MTVTSGFFNAINSDRRYDALQMAELFDGLINDGVYETLYNRFRVSPNGNGLAVQVDTGRGWFSHTWIKNDTILVLPVQQPELMFSRIDAVVVEVNHKQTVRRSYIRMVTGTPSPDPVRPTLQKSDDIYQYPLAYVRVNAGDTSISAANITNMVGSKDCPFVTGVVSVMDIDMLVAQWEAQWGEWVINNETVWRYQWEEWLYKNKNDFIDWFEDLRAALEPEVAEHLAEKIADIYHIIKTLALEHALYYPLEDDNGDPVLDNFGKQVYGTTNFVTGLPISEDEVDSLFL